MSTWLVLAFANMITLAGLRLIQKSFVNHSQLNTFRLNWMMTAFGLPIFVIIVIMQFDQIAQLSASFWLMLVAVVIGFYPLVNYLYFKTIRANDLSEVLPLLGLVPIVILGLGWILLGQRPSPIGLLGVLLISISIYALQFKQGTGLLDPFKKIFTASAARAMLIISIITAFAAVGDKFAIERSSVGIYFALNSIGAFLVLLLCDITFGRKSAGETTPITRKLSLKLSFAMILMGILLLSTQLLGFAALKVAPVAGYAVGIRNLNLVVASIAALVFLSEPITRNKSLSYGVSAIGVILIAV